MVLKLCKFQHFLLKLLTKFYYDRPVLFNSIPKISIILPIFFFLDFFDRELKHFAFRLQGATLIEKQS